MVTVAAIGIPLTSKLPIEAILYLLLHSLSTVSVVENSRGKVCGFRKGEEEAKKRKNSLREITLRLKRGGSSPPKYFFHIFVRWKIYQLETLFLLLLLFMADKEMLSSSTKAQSVEASTGGGEESWTDQAWTLNFSCSLQGGQDEEESVSLLLSHSPLQAIPTSNKRSGLDLNSSFAFQLRQDRMN